LTCASLSALCCCAILAWSSATWASLSLEAARAIRRVGRYYLRFVQLVLALPGDLLVFGIGLVLAQLRLRVGQRGLGLINLHLERTRVDRGDQLSFFDR